MSLKRWLFEGVFVVAAITVGAVLSLQPWHVLKKEQRLQREKETQARDAEKQYVHDTKLEARYGSRLGHEELARARGLHMPGETTLKP
jgi:hypothetical protein